MFPISDFFTRDQYNKMLEKRRAKEKIESNAIPHYLIALEQPLDVIIKHIDLKDPNYHESRFGLTPLTVSVMMKNHPVVDYLLNRKGVKPDPKDSAGLTPMVYAAALCDVQSLELIQKASQIDKVKTDIFDLFPYWKPLFKPAFPDDNKIVCYTVDNQPLSAAQFKKRTNARFYSDVVVTKQDFLTFLAFQLEHINSMDDIARQFSKYLSKQYPQFMKNPPRFLVGSQGEAGDGLFAGQNISAFQLCGIYGGKIDFTKSQNEEDTAYRFGFFNAKEIRNLPTIINDAFPNCAFIEFHLSDGRIYMGLMTLREIKKGEPVYVDYGKNHFIKFVTRQELNWDEMTTYFKQNSLHSLFHEYLNLVPHLLGKKNKQRAMKYILRARAIQFRVAYLFNTPTALLSLCRAKTIKSNEVIALLSNKNFTEQLEIDEISKKDVIDKIISNGLIRE